MLCSNIGINESGHLTFAGEDTVRLAAHYKTPLYLMDEDRIRENCRIYKTAMERAFGAGSYPLYASKAASFKRMYTIMQEEKMAIDVVSAGEIATAKRAGFSMERAYSTVCTTVSHAMRGSPPKKSSSSCSRLAERSIRKSIAFLPVSGVIMQRSPPKSPCCAKQYSQRRLQSWETFRHMDFTGDLTIVSLYFS